MLYYQLISTHRPGLKERAVYVMLIISLTETVAVVTCAVGLLAVAAAVGLLGLGGGGFGRSGSLGLLLGLRDRQTDGGYQYGQTDRSLRR